MLRSAFSILLAAFSVTLFSVSASVMMPDSTTVIVNIVGLTDADSIPGLSISVEDPAFDQTHVFVMPRIKEGLFERKFLLSNAQFADIKIPPYNYIVTYLEPGGDLIIEVNADKLKKRNGFGRNLSKFASFRGSLCEINDQLSKAPDLTDDFNFWNVDKSISPYQVKDSLIRIYDCNIQKINNYVASLPSDNKIAEILKANELMRLYNNFADYADHNESHPILPRDYYKDFLNALFHSDATVLGSRNVNHVLNLIGYSKFLPSRRMSIDINLVRKNIKFLADRGCSLTPEEMSQLNKLLDMSNNAPTIQDLDLFKQVMVLNHILFSAADRCGIRDEFMAQFDQSLDFAAHSEAKAYSEASKKTDPQFLRDYFNLEGEDMPIVWQYAVCAREWENIVSADSLDIDSYGISDPTLRERLVKAYNDVRENSGNVIPDNYVGNYLREIIKPFAGKYLLLDVWDLYCPPCRETIQTSQEFREQHVNDPDFAFLYVATLNGAPKAGYDDYISKYLSKESVKFIDEFQLMCLKELFSFTWFPYYVIFDRDGSVLKTDAQYWQFVDLLKKKGLVD